MSTVSRQDSGPEALRRRAVWVGVDGSSASLAAVRWAADEAVSRNLALTLVYASPSVDPNSRQEGHGQAVLSVAGDEAHRHAPAVETTTELVADATVPALLRASERAALLVLGLTGSGGLGETLLGSTTLAVSGQAHCPVVGVRRWPLPNAATGAIVVGVSSAETDSQAIEVAFERAHRRGRTLVVVHAGRRSVDTDERNPLIEALSVWRHRYPDVAVEFHFAQGSPATALLSKIDQVESIVTGCRRRGQAARALLGSTSRSVLRSSPVPVIVTNPDTHHEPYAPSLAAEPSEPDPRARSGVW